MKPVGVSSPVRCALHVCNNSFRQTLSANSSVVSSHHRARPSVCRIRCPHCVPLVIWAPIKKPSQVREWWVWKPVRRKADRGERWIKKLKVVKPRERIRSSGPSSGPARTCRSWTSSRPEINRLDRFTQYEKSGWKANTVQLATFLNLKHIYLDVFKGSLKDLAFISFGLI